MAIETYISEEKLHNRIKELGAQITNDFQGEEIVLVCVLQGSFMFMADLARQIKVPVICDFVGASSYGAETESSGNVKITTDLKHDIKGKNVILVEDIVDTGNTIVKLTELLAHRGAKSLKLASLLFKPERLENDVKIDYLGFEIENKFVIGYGLDFDGRYRELPFVGIYSEN